MQAWIIDVMNKFGFFGIALLIALENIFPPIPSEVILTFGGFMTTPAHSTLTPLGVIIAATIGSVLGAILLYGVGRLFSADRLARLLEGFVSKVLRFKKDDVYKACNWFNTSGKKAVLICRFVPIVRSLISIPAGMAKMRFDVFLILTALGSIAWNTFLVCLGIAAGTSWEKVVECTNIYTSVTIVVLCAAIITAVLWYMKYRKRVNKNKEQ